MVLRCLLYIRWVILTGAFLAEAAAAVDNKLDVRGGVLAACEVGPDHIAKVTLVVLTRAEAGDKAAKLNIEVVKPSGDSESVELDIPGATLGGENGFAFFPIGIQAETYGRYVLEVTSGGGSVSLPLRLQPGGLHLTATRRNKHLRQ